MFSLKRLFRRSDQAAPSPLPSPEEELQQTIAEASQGCPYQIIRIKPSDGSSGGIRIVTPDHETWAYTFREGNRIDAFDLFSEHSVYWYMDTWWLIACPSLWGNDSPERMSLVYYLHNIVPQLFQEWRDLNETFCSTYGEILQEYNYHLNGNPCARATLHHIPQYIDAAGNAKEINGLEFEQITLEALYSIVQVSQVPHYLDYVQRVVNAHELLHTYHPQYMPRQARFGDSEPFIVTHPDHNLYNLWSPETYLIHKEFVEESLKAYEERVKRSITRCKRDREMYADPNRDEFVAKLRASARENAATEFGVI